MRYTIRVDGSVVEEKLQDRFDILYSNLHEIEIIQSKRKNSGCTYSFDIVARSYNKYLAK